MEFIECDWEDFGDRDATYPIHMTHNDVMFIDDSFTMMN